MNPEVVWLLAIGHLYGNGAGAVRGQGVEVTALGHEGEAERTAKNVSVESCLAGEYDHVTIGFLIL